MIYVDFDFPPSLDELSREVTVYVNDNVLSVINYYIEISEEPDTDELLEEYFPRRFFANNRERAIDTIYELHDAVASSFIHNELSPLHNYVLYHFLEAYSEMQKDMPEILGFIVPEELKAKIRKGYQECCDEEDRMEICESVIECLKSADAYIDYLFEDTDFLSEHIRGLALLAMHKPYSFERVMNYDELDQYIDVMPGDIARSYKAFRAEMDELLKQDAESAIVNTILNALNSMHKRVAHFCEMGEVQITTELDSIIEVALADTYGIYTKREYNMGRSLKTLGETDLYFYKNENGRLIDLAILENKEIERFRNQYLQLMGYLNAFFKFGITLSINRKHTLEHAVNMIVDTLKSIEGEYAVTGILESNENYNHLISEHIVPETGTTMRVHHFILNLCDESRVFAAKESRK